MTTYRSEAGYGLVEIRRLLEAIDQALEAPAELVLLGGGAAAFHHAVSTTMDLDTFTTIPPVLQAALDKAVLETRLGLQTSHAAVADVPWEFESRLEEPIPHLTMLRVRILERHDLALSKIVRGYSHDFQQLEEMHRALPFAFDTLVTRFVSEMQHVVGEPHRIRGNFLDLIGQLFNEIRRVEAERQTRTWQAKPSDPQ